MYLSKGNIPQSVYDNLIETVHAHLPALHEYMSLRKKMLGVEHLHTVSYTHLDVYKRQNEDIDEDALANMHGYLNVDLFGLDNRSNGSYDEGNSDCIIIASLNYDTKEVQLVSLYRDTYLSSGNGRYTKANGAYSAGGVKRAISMVNSNLDLNITKYICVDWKALVDAIDDLGGVDLDVTQDEVDEINYPVSYTHLQQVLLYMSEHRLSL